MQKRHHLFAVLIITLAAGGLVLGADEPGKMHIIRPEDLPPPFETPSANNFPGSSLDRPGQS